MTLINVEYGLFFFLAVTAFILTVDFILGSKEAMGAICLIALFVIGLYILDCTGACVQKAIKIEQEKRNE
jgi:hypothetical protein